jgi:hypothetical protein
MELIVCPSRPITILDIYGIDGINSLSVASYHHTGHMELIVCPSRPITIYWTYGIDGINLVCTLPVASYHHTALDIWN